MNYEQRATSDKRRIMTIHHYTPSLIYLIMQNKPNLPEVQMNITTVLKKHYENKRLVRRGENKPNSNPIKPNFTPKTNIHPQNKPNQSQFPPQKPASTPETNPIKPISLQFLNVFERFRTFPRIFAGAADYFTFFS